MMYVFRSTEGKGTSHVVKDQKAIKQHCIRRENKTNLHEWTWRCSLAAWKARRSLQMMIIGHQVTHFSPSTPLPSKNHGVINVFILQFKKQERSRLRRSLAIRPINQRQRHTRSIHTAARQREEKDCTPANRRLQFPTPSGISRVPWFLRCRIRGLNCGGWGKSTVKCRKQQKWPKCGDADAIHRKTNTFEPDDATTSSTKQCRQLHWIVNSLTRRARELQWPSGRYF